MTPTKHRPVRSPEEIAQKLVSEYETKQQFSMGWPSGEDKLRQCIADAIRAERADNMCDICLGEPLASGRQCACNGTGKMSVAALYFREQMVNAENRLERARTAVSPEAFEAWYASHDPHTTTIGTVKDRDHSCWQAATQAERDRVRKLLSQEWIDAEFTKYDSDLSRTQDSPTWPEWVASEEDYFMECYKLIRDRLFGDCDKGEGK